MPPQQRTVNNRGSLQPANVRPIADMAWTIASVVGNVVTVTIDSDPARLFMQSVPPFRGEAPAQAVASAILTGNSLELTFPGAPDGGSAIEILSAQPGIRNNLGAYLAAGRQLTPVPVVAPPDVTAATWVIDGVAAGYIQMSATLGVGEVLLVGEGVFAVTSGTFVPDALQIQGAVMRLTGMGTALPGDTVEVVTLGLTNGMASLRVLEAKTEVVV